MKNCYIIRSLLLAYGMRAVHDKWDLRHKAICVMDVEVSCNQLNMKYKDSSIYQGNI